MIPHDGWNTLRERVRARVVRRRERGEYSAPPAVTAIAPGAFHSATIERGGGWRARGKAGARTPPKRGEAAL